jgi:hypothetical protein
MDNTVYPTSRRTAVEQLPSLLDRRNELCIQCAAFDFQAIATSKVSSKNGTRLLDLGFKSALRRSHCPLCWLFYHFSPHPARDSDWRTQRLQLRAFSTNLTFMRFSKELDTDPLSDRTMLGVVEWTPTETVSGGALMDSCLQNKGFITITDVEHPNRAFSSRFIQPDSFDFKIACYWLNYCCENHTSSCGNATRPTIGSLRVIDCVTRTVVTAPLNCEYVALSYVWGPPLSSVNLGAGSTSEVSEKHLTFPKTIEDSIYVTLQLSFRYLWVDRYCIDQDDQDDKHTQISQMDSIYSAARLTIIAAAGEAPDHGLPGINGTTRICQQSLRVGNHLLNQTLPHPIQSVLKSKWATRGWTFQEGILSHKRLVFTADQVLWDCDGMHCSEVLDLPLDDMHTKSRARLRAHVPPGSFGTKVSGNDSYDVMRFVSDYYKRELSYPADTLNAIRGILSAFTKGSPKVYHLSGIPIFSWTPTRELNLLPNAMEQSIVRGLFWYHAEPGKRRKEFPSWSWAGWQYGYIHPQLYRPDWVLSQQFYGVGVSIEDANGHLHVPSREQFPVYLASIDNHANFIQIDAWTLTCDIVKVNLDVPPYTSKKLEYSSGYYARFLINDKDTCLAKLHLSSSSISTSTLALPRTNSWDRFLNAPSSKYSSSLSDTYIGIIIPEYHEGPGWRPEFGAAHVLVVEDKGDWHERIGCFHIYDEYWSRRSFTRLDAPCLEAMLGFDDKGELEKPIRYLPKLRDGFKGMPRTRRTIRLG